MNILTIAINTYSRRDKFYLTKLSYHLNNQIDKNFKIIVIADGNQEFIKELEMLFDNARIIQSNGMNLAQSRNLALREADADIVAFIDDDAYPDENWTKEIKSLFSNSDVIGGGGFVKPIFERKTRIPFELYWLFGCTYFLTDEDLMQTRNPIGCNMAVRRENALEIEGFDESMGRSFGILLSGEETDFFIKLCDRYPNKEIMYDSSLIVNHHVSKNRIKFRYFLKRSFYEGVTKKYLKKKRKKTTALRIEKSYLLEILYKSIPKYFIKGSFAAVFYLITCVFSVLFGYLFARFFMKN